MIRVRLTLWNTIVLAVVLSALAIAVYITTAERLRDSIDSKLESRGKLLAKGWPQYYEVRRGRPPRPQQELDLFKNSGLEPAQIQRLKFELEIQRPRHLNVGGVGFFRPQDQAFDLKAHTAALHGKTTFSKATIEEGLARIYTVPISLNGKPAGSIQIAASLVDTEDALQHLQYALLVLLPVALVLTSLAGVFLTGRALRPVVQISRATEQIEASNLEGRLPVRGKDEFAILATQINSMLSRLEQSFKNLETAYQTQRLFTADASHELKTPLTAIKTRVGIARRSVDSPEKQLEHLNAINRSADSMNAIVQDLLLLAKSESGAMDLRLQRVNVLELIDRVVHELGPNYSEHVQVTVPSPVFIEADFSTFSRAIRNLVENGIRHTPAGSNICISANQAGGQVQISVKDKGLGIESHHLPHLFDRFYRVDPSRQRESGGSGLGLAIVKSIIEAHRGTVTITSDVGEGTEVLINLPALD